MLKKNMAHYRAVIKRLPLLELTKLHKRSLDYPLLRGVIEREIDDRLSPKTTNTKQIRQLITTLSEQELSSSF